MNRNPKITVDELIQILKELKDDNLKTEILIDATQFIDYYYKRIGPRSGKVTKDWYPNRIFFDKERNQK